MKFLKLYEDINWNEDDFDEEEFDYEEDDPNIENIVNDFINPTDTIIHMDEHVGNNILKINTNRWSEFVNVIKKFDIDIKWISGNIINYNNIVNFISTYKYDDLDIIYIFFKIIPYKIYFREPQDINESSLKLKGGNILEIL